MVAVRAASTLTEGKLDFTAHLRAFWPNTELLPADQRQRFLDREQVVNLKTTVQVKPDLPTGADVMRPLASLRLNTGGQQTVDGAQVPLRILASPDAQRMYLREWTLDPQSGKWRVARSSGWIGYMEHFTWTLSTGHGVKYIGVWVADAAKNTSALSEASLAFINRVDGAQTLADGQRVQYRGAIANGALALGYLTTVSGDPDLYIWGPRNAFRPNLRTDDTVAPGQWEQMGTHRAERSGRFLMEVQAVGPSEYRLSLSGLVGAAGEASAEKARPAHPLTVSDPLSAGDAKILTIHPGALYLPVVAR